MTVTDFIIGVCGFTFALVFSLFVIGVSSDALKYHESCDPEDDDQ